MAVPLTPFFSIQEQPWGILIPFTGKTSKIYLKKSRITFGIEDWSQQVRWESFIENVSTIHFLIYRHDDRVFLEDYSINKTLVNNATVGGGHAVELKHGDRISICNIPDCFKFLNLKI